MDRASNAQIDLEAGAAGDARLPQVDADSAWRLLLGLRRRADGSEAAAADEAWGFGAAGEEWLPAHGHAAEVWLQPRTGAVLRARVGWTRDAGVLLERHGQHAACSRARGQVVAVLGQSLDGFIATRSGQSRYINGPESLTHLHRIRALSDAVLIGVGTALADGPRLTTRNVEGPHAVRVVVDPRGRLAAGCGLLCDGAARTLVIRATAGRAFESRLTDQATALHLASDDGRIAPAAILEALGKRGLTRILVEGGGITVGRFLEAGLLDRLQLAVSPVVLGAGRPALPIAPADRLEGALRPRCRRHQLGEDVLFELCFGGEREGG